MMRKIMIYGIMLGTLLIGEKAYAAKATAEVVSGDKSSTLDVKASGEIAPKVGIFARHRETLDYDNHLRHFSLADVTYAVGHGVNAVVEAQFVPNAGLVPRLGFQYATSAGGLDMFVLATVAARENVDGEGITLFRYSPSLCSSVRLFTQVETVTNISKEGLNFSEERLRLGLDIRGYRFGAAADITTKREASAPMDMTESDSELIHGYNVGGFVEKTF